MVNESQINKETILKEIQELTLIFFSDHVRNRWIETDEAAIYLRKGTHAVNGKLTKFIDVANIVIKQKGAGICTDFLRWLQTQKVNIYVENIISPILERICRKEGFTMCNDVEDRSNLDCSYWFFENKENDEKNL